MKVVLISPPRYFKNANIPSYTGFSQNLGLGYIAATLQQYNIDVSIIDAFATHTFTPVPEKNIFYCGLSNEDIINKIDPTTNFIGISMPFTNVSDIVFNLAKNLKKAFPNVKIILGGIHASAFPKESMTEGVDYVIVGEGELAMVSLVTGVPLDSIDGLVWRLATTIHINKKIAKIEDLNTIPFPARNLLPMELYLGASQRGDSRRCASLITSRGCPFNCNFCSVHPVSGRLWRARSPENVLSEIKLLADVYRVNHLEIEDDNFTIKKDRVLNILSELQNVAPGITWSAHNGVMLNTLDEELLSIIKKSGCIQLNLAIEHGSKSVLRAMNKQISLEKVKEVVNICAKLGIRTIGFCIVGHPGENWETFLESAKFYASLKQMGLTHIVPFIVNAYPSTSLYKEAKLNNWLMADIDNHFFCAEDNYVSVITPDATADVVLKRKNIMEMIDSNPHVNIDELVYREKIHG
jgi:anaerobic magnesium-protoporphyrin IX monomethyl ester cyclase